MQDEYKDRPLQQNDAVALHIEELEKLKKKDSQKYDEVMMNLTGVFPFDTDAGKVYLVRRDEKQKEVQLVGSKVKGAKSVGADNAVAIDMPFPVEYLVYREPEDEDGFTASERREYGLDD